MKTKLYATNEPDVTVYLPFDLKPTPCITATRLGRKMDGGYVVDGRSLPITSRILSFGLGTDWSFESHFQQLTGCTVEIYDASVGRATYTKHVIKSLLSLNPHRVYQALRTLCQYLHYYSKPQNNHITKFVGPLLSSDYIGFNDITKRIDSDQQRTTFLKIDIEGGEYRILEDIKAYSKHLTGLIVEFHDIDLHMDKLRDFINTLDMQLININANNQGNRTRNDIPLVIECTFSPFNDTEGEKDTSKDLNLPNDPSTKKYSIEYVKTTP